MKRVILGFILSLVYFTSCGFTETYYGTEAWVMFFTYAPQDMGSLCPTTNAKTGERGYVSIDIHKKIKYVLTLSEDNIDGHKLIIYKNINVAKEMTQLYKIQSQHF
jgi:hypothetical protein